MTPRDDFPRIGKNGHKGYEMAKPEHPLKKADEYDIFTSWRRVMFWQRGEIAKVKRRINKRNRQKAKKEINKEVT